MGLETMALGATAGSTGLGAVSQLASGYQEKKIAKYNAQVLEYQAGHAEKIGQEQALALARGREQAIGAQRTGFASGNVDVNSGSAALVQQQTAALAAEDIARVKNNAALAAWGYRVEAKNMKYAGKLALKTGIGNAAGTLLGGAGDIYAIKKDKHFGTYP